mgnify:CR=1 FL=1
MALRVHRRPAVIATVLCALYLFCWLQFPIGNVAFAVFLPLLPFFAIGYGGYEALTYTYLVSVLLVLWLFLYTMLGPSQKGKG